MRKPMRGWPHRRSDARGPLARGENRRGENRPENISRNLIDGRRIEGAEQGLCSSSQRKVRPAERLADAASGRYAAAD